MLETPISALANSPPVTTTQGPRQPTSSDFLSLLTAQLTQQDPLEPMSNEQMMNQIVSIQTIEGLNELQVSIDALSRQQGISATDLLGKSVELSFEGETVSGQVEGIRWNGAEPQLVVGGRPYPESTVVSVRQ